MFDLSGRVALVTGASSGIGERFARILAGSGAAVVLAARRIDRLEGACAAIEAAGGRAIAVAMDVADESSTIAAYDAAEAAFGTVDSIIANAGMNAEGPVTDLPVAEFDQVMAVNLRGVFLTAREGAKRLIAAGSREHGHGRIVITASITAHKVDAGLAVYSASKAGVVQMGKVMARDWVRAGHQRQHDLSGLYPHRTQRRLVRHGGRCEADREISAPPTDGRGRPRFDAALSCVRCLGRGDRHVVSRSTTGSRSEDAAG